MFSAEGSCARTLILLHSASLAACMNWVIGITVALARYDSTECLLPWGTMEASEMYGVEFRSHIRQGLVSSTAEPTKNWPKACLLVGVRFRVRFRGVWMELK